MGSSSRELERMASTLDAVIANNHRWLWSPIQSLGPCRLAKVSACQCTCAHKLNFQYTRRYVQLRHQISQSNANVDPQQLNFAGRPLYQLAVCIYKVCACLGYLRLFKGTNSVKYVGRITRFVQVFIFVIIVGHLATTLVILLQCRPVEKGWKPWIDGQCLPNYSTWNVRKSLLRLCGPYR